MSSISNQMCAFATIALLVCSTANCYQSLRKYHILRKGNNKQVGRIWNFLLQFESLQVNAVNMVPSAIIILNCVTFRKTWIIYFLVSHTMLLVLRILLRTHF